MQSFFSFFFKKTSVYAVIFFIFFKKTSVYAVIFFIFFKKTSVVGVIHDLAAGKGPLWKRLCAFFETLPSRQSLDGRGFFEMHNNFLMPPAANSLP